MMLKFCCARFQVLYNNAYSNLAFDSVEHKFYFFRKYNYNEVIYHLDYCMFCGAKL